MIKFLVMDVDGTLTNGKINITVNGELYKSFDVKDGYGIKALLPQNSIIPIILTSRDSTILLNRSRELGIEYVFQNVESKEEKLCAVVEELNCEWANVAYIGDDLNDLACIKMCGISACPKDAVEVIKSNVNFVCSRKGGDGAVREFIEYIINNCIKEQ